MKEALHTFNVDTNRVYVAGYSNGGTGALHYASFWPHRLAAVVLLMGHGIYAPDFAAPPLLANVAQLSMLFLHGDKDEVIPVQFAKGTVGQLRWAAPSAAVEMHILEGRGPDVTLASDEGLTLPFLEGRKREPFPRKVTFHARTLQFPRHYWIEILDKRKGVAEVEGTIAEDNTMRLKTRKVHKLRLLLRRELFPRDGPVRILNKGKEVFAGTLSEDCTLLQKSWIQTADPFLAHSAELIFTVPE